MKWLAQLELDNYEHANYPQFTCEFWINNFQFEVFYDLSKHIETTPTIESNGVMGGCPEPRDSPVTQDEGSCGVMCINDLPNEMLSQVFSFVTAVDLLVVQGVCQRWHAIVKQDKALWNHVLFSAADFDIKTTASLVKEMPLLQSIDLGNVHSSEDMALLTSALCDACWQLRQIHFPESCDWHPSAHDLHQLQYFHPTITSLQLCTKQKLTPAEISNLGAVLGGFPFLTRLKLVGFYWHQPELLPELLAKLEHLNSLSLPSFPGLNGLELKQLTTLLPNLKTLTLNISSIRGTQLSFINLASLKDVRIMDSSANASEKLSDLNKITSLTSLDINLSRSKKESVMAFFGSPHPALRELEVSNCEFSCDLLTCLPQSCPGLRRLVWMNPKDASGELADAGLLAVTRLPLLHALEVKSRSVSKTYYPQLAAMKSLKYARINGMRVPGCL